MTDDLIPRAAAMAAMQSLVPPYSQYTPAHVVDAQAALHAVQVGVKPLEWKDGDRNGDFYCEVPIGHGFSGYYQIIQQPHDLAIVEFGVHCHEFGGSEIWKGPKDGAKAAAQAAAQADYEARIRSALTLTPAQIRADALREAADAIEWKEFAHWLISEWQLGHVAGQKAARATILALIPTGKE